MNSQQEGNFDLGEPATGKERRIADRMRGVERAGNRLIDMAASAGEDESSLSSHPIGQEMASFFKKQMDLVNGYKKEFEEAKTPQQQEAAQYGIQQAMRTFKGLQGKAEKTLASSSDKGQIAVLKNFSEKMGGMVKFASKTNQQMENSKSGMHPFVAGLLAGMGVVPDGKTKPQQSQDRHNEPTASSEPVPGP